MGKKTDIKPLILYGIATKDLYADSEFRRLMRKLDDDLERRSKERDEAYREARKKLADDPLFFPNWYAPPNLNRPGFPFCPRR